MTRRAFGALSLVALLLGGCYTLDRRDIFEVAFKPPSAAALSGLSDADHRVRPLTITGFARPISAYWDDGRDARGFLIFFNGNGYGAEAALRRMLVPARKLHLDLVVFDYFDEGQPAPTIAETQKLGDALYDT